MGSFAAGTVFGTVGGAFYIIEAGSYLLLPGMGSVEYAGADRTPGTEEELENFR